MKKYIYIVFLFVLFVSCAELQNIAIQVPGVKLPGSQSVTNAETVTALKNSLMIGSEKASLSLGAENGFFKNMAYKLLLPEEAQPIVDNIKLIPGGQALLDKAVLSLNRSAEDAVKEATPIFKSAIVNMSVSDAVGILFGNDNAATEYLRRSTYSKLKVAFAPKVKASLDKPLVANVSTSKSWTTLTSSYNKVAGSAVGVLAGLKVVNVNLEQYATEKALDALFSKVAEEEKNIRKNPAARINDLLKKVFGQLDKK